MNFNPEEILQICSIIWDATLGLPIEPHAGDWIGNRPRSTVSCIQIAGAWNGAILLDCSADLARLAASLMFGAQPENVAMSDLQDAVAELVNMIGGNFKALLPETCYLSLPSVVEGGDYSTRVPGSKSLGRVTFVCEGHAISIAVLERVEQQTAAA